MLVLACVFVLFARLLFPIALSLVAFVTCLSLRFVLLCECMVGLFCVV